MTLTKVLVAVGLSLAAATTALAQPPLLTNGQVRAQEVSGPLDRIVNDLASQAAAPVWIGYEVAATPGDRFMCDWHEWSGNRPVATSVKLEPSNVIFVFYRVEDKRVTRIRIFSEGCGIDAGGRTVHWLTGVRPRDSVALLGTFTGTAGDRRVSDGAISAMAMHADPSAIETLITLARSGPTQVRGQSLFWLSQRAGDKAIGAIADAIDRDPDTEVKKKAVFALSQLPKDEGVPRLIDVARSHSNAAIRKQAMFWLGQSRDPRALAFFESILLK